MTVESLPKLDRRFAQVGLPWLVAAAALATYLVTLNQWVTLNSLALVVRTSGWNSQPMLSQPLLCLVTLPFRWLPASWVPLALNVFTAVCAALTLATLARSVALLPHDCLEQQRRLVQNEHSLLSVRSAWVPIVLASAALGLQLSFWEQAIAASAEMLDLLLFACVIRCVLEHRIDGRQSWLDRAAFLFGCAMANNWGMIVFLPLFPVVVFRSKQLSFFSLRALRRIDRTGWEDVRPALNADLRFFLRTVLFGLAGSSLFLLLPLVQAFSPHSTLSFWQALHATAVSHWIPFRIFTQYFRFHRDLALLLAAASLLPILLLSIRWGAFGDEERHNWFDLASFISHVFHAFLLLICLWTVFDPPFSPRQMAHQNGITLSFLPLYYLTALSIGYYSGFFLLSFGPQALERTGRRFAARRLLCRVVPVFVYILAGLTLVGLLLENVPAIRAYNAPHLDRYARLLAGSLPQEGAVVLSDDPARLWFLQAALAREGKVGGYMAVDTQSLPLAGYRDWLKRKYPGRWPQLMSEARLGSAGPGAADASAPWDAVSQFKLMISLLRSNRVCYLQPGFGPLLDRFCLLPSGLFHEVRSYPPELFDTPPSSSQRGSLLWRVKPGLPDNLSYPRLTSAELEENQAFWRLAVETGARPLLGLISQAELPRSAFGRWLMESGHLQTPPTAQARVLGRWYSGALNRWGVTLQRNGKLSEATPFFTLAQKLNPDNLPARINWQCNSNLSAQQEMIVDRTLSLQELFGRGRGVAQVLIEDGPLDDPSCCYCLGQALAAEGLGGQACQQFERLAALVPGDIQARLVLGDLYNRSGMHDFALNVVEGIRADPAFQPLDPTNKVDMAFLEARAYLSMTNRLMARGIIESLMFEHPRDATVMARAAAVLADYQCYSDAFRITDQQLQLNPRDTIALVNKGNLCVLIGDHSNAIPPLTLALSLTNSPVARHLRALAYSRTGSLDAAEADYQEILRVLPNAYSAYAGLSEIAERRKDIKAAVRYCEQYLSRARADTEQARTVAARLKSLQQVRQ